MMKLAALVLTIGFVSPAFSQVNTLAADQADIVCKDGQTEVRIYAATDSFPKTRMVVQQMDGQLPLVLYAGVVQDKETRGYNHFASPQASLFVLQSKDGMHGVLNVQTEDQPILASRTLRCQTMYRIQPIQTAATF